MKPDAEYVKVSLDSSRIFRRETVGFQRLEIYSEYVGRWIIRSALAKPPCQTFVFNNFSQHGIQPLFYGRSRKLHLTRKVVDSG